MPDVIVNTGGNDWLTPAATLVAVILGGIVSFGVQYALSRRRERAEAKAAARVIQGDLAIAAGQLQDMIEKDPTWYSFRSLTLPNWDERQAVLALLLAPEGWEVVSQSAIELRGLTEGWKIAFGPGGPRAGQQKSALSSTQLQNMRTLWSNASDAHRALSTLARTKPEQGLLHEGT